MGSFTEAPNLRRRYRHNRNFVCVAMEVTHGYKLRRRRQMPPEQLRPGYAGK